MEHSPLDLNTWLEKELAEFLLETEDSKKLDEGLDVIGLIIMGAEPSPEQAEEINNIRKYFISMNDTVVSNAIDAWQEKQKQRGRAAVAFADIVSQLYLVS